MITKQQILEETYNYYTADPNGRRSIDPITKNCLYNGPNGKHCAFARCCDEEKLKDIPEYDGSTYVGADMFMDRLKPEYIHITDGEFWREIQCLHDYAQYWDKENNTVSDYGRAEYQKLLEKYKN